MSGRVSFMLGRALRETGQALDRFGMMMQGNHAFKEQLCRHRRVMPLFDKTPTIGSGAFVAPDAGLIGNVSVGEGSAVFYSSVLRGDTSPISIGSNTSVGDRSLIGAGSKIGNDVVIGQGTILNNVTVGDSSVIEPGAILSEGASVGAGSCVSSGSQVAANTVIPDGQFWAGSPAKYLRDVSAEEKQSFASLSSQTLELAAVHREEQDKSESQRQKDRDGRELYQQELYKETPF